MKKILSVAALVILSACSSTEEIANNDVDDNSAKGEGYRCEKMSVLGTSIPRKICTTAAQRAVIAANAEETSDQIRRSTISCTITNPACNRG